MTFTPHMLADAFEVLENQGKKVALVFVNMDQFVCMGTWGSDITTRDTIWGAVLKIRHNDPDGQVTLVAADDPTEHVVKL